MSSFRLPNLRRMASSIGRVGSRLARRRRRSMAESTSRRLLVDALEERVLLTVLPGHVEDVRVNQSVIGPYFDPLGYGPLGDGGAATISGQSVAVDHDGDFVVTWTRYDELYELDPVTGEPAIDPITGHPVAIVDPETGLQMTDGNVYARYFTDEVQRVTLPEEVAADNVAGNYGTFSLKVGGNEVQKLEISATYQPTYDIFDPFGGIGFGFGMQEDMSGDFNLGFDVDRNGVISAVETTTILYDEAPPIGVSDAQHLRELAATIQTGLQGLGGELNDVVVEPIDLHEFLIHFGDAAMGQDQPEITVESFSFSAGFLPAVMVSTVREPVELTNIPVSPDDPGLTSLAIEQSFLGTSENYLIGPMEFFGYAPDVDPWAYIAPYYSPLVMREPNPRVSVTPVSTTQFDVRFINNSGKQDHPELVITAVKDDLGNQLTASLEVGVVTMKQPSPEFRVNPEEPDNPVTILPDKFDQVRPAVAIDADGEFVIAWESEVPYWENFGSVSDIFARQFTPVGMAESSVFVPGQMIPGVRALTAPGAQDVQVIEFDATGLPPLAGPFRLRLGEATTETIGFDSDDLGGLAAAVDDALAAIGYGDATVMPISSTDPYQLEVRFGGEFLGRDLPVMEYIADPADPLAANVSVLDVSGDMSTFRVNTQTANAQGQPCVGIDDAGNFTIVWAGVGQDVSYFNSILGQRYDRHGNPLGGEYVVNNPNTNEHILPTVEISSDGTGAVVWSETWGGFSPLRAVVFDPAGVELVPQFSIGAAGQNPSVAFDMDNNFIVAWYHLTRGDLDDDHTAGGDSNSSGVRAQMYEIQTDPATGTSTASLIRNRFRVNSAAFDPNVTTEWPWFQSGPDAGIDADGDLIVTYEGYGPDVSEDAMLLTMATSFLAEEINSQRNADLLTFFDPSFNSLPIFFGSFYFPFGDIDIILEEVFVEAQGMGATDAQLGRLRAILDDVIGLVRGESNGVMYSRFDTFPTDPLNILNSDTIINSQRDGHNQRYLIAIDEIIDGGNFDLSVNGERVKLNVVSSDDDPPILLPYDTRDQFNADLEAATSTGLNWEERVGYEGGVEVRLVNTAFLTAEFTARQGTHWDIVGDPLTNPFFSLIQPTDYVYEVTFQGEGHDDWVSVGYPQGRYNWLVWYDVDGNAQDGPPPYVIEYMSGAMGTMQTEASLGMEPDGDFVTAWTQIEEYTSGSGYSLITMPAFPSNQNIYFRTVDEGTDTAGPRVTDLVAPNGDLVDNGGTIEGPLQHLVMTFDEEMRIFDEELVAWALGERDWAIENGQQIPANVLDILDSINNVENFRLYQNGVEIVGGITKVEFGMSLSSERADEYGLSPVPSNKWEVVFTFDGNPVDAALSPLASGLYTIEALSPALPRSGLRDKVANPLGHTGFTVGGDNVARDFIVVVGTTDDTPVTDDPAVGSGFNGRTYPETPGAVALDGDGDHIVAWTGYDPSLGRDRAFARVYEADGDPAATNPVFFQVTPPDTDPLFSGDEQRFVTVACDQDGDFVVTWTNYRDNDGDGLNEEQDVYARRFYANGSTAGVPFRVNTYTEHNQTWPNVAMDADGDFIVTWSSYGQEDHQQGGYGYGVYARRYDSFGQPLAPEFQVNVTTAGNQQFSSVAMDKDGGFVVAWTSDQNGVGDDIIARSFHSDGSPQVSILGGELMCNQTVIGNQRYPDVSMNLEGSQFVVTWSSSSQDGDGWGIYGRRILRPLGPDDQATVFYSSTDVPVAIPDDPAGQGIVVSTINVTDNFNIRDLNVTMTIITPESEDMEVYLEHVGSGARILLCDLLPKQGRDFTGTEFDDEATVFIAGPSASPPYTGPHVPEQPLSAVDLMSVSGTWQLVIDDMVDNHLWNRDIVRQRLDKWSMKIWVDLAAGPEFAVNTTTFSDQLYSSIAMDHTGDFTVAWSGYGNQLGQEDKSANGVFYQRYDSTGSRTGAETRVNNITDGNQWIPSIANDADGNFVVAWTGEGLIPATTEVFKVVSAATIPALDSTGPLVTDVLQLNRDRVLQDYVLSAPMGVEKLIVVFNENLSKQDGVLGRDSVTNPDNWSLERNGTQIPNAIDNVIFGINPVSRKHEATVTFDGNGFNPGTPALPPGAYVLTVRDQISDGVNSLDGNYDGIPGTDPAGTGQDGYKFNFSVASGPQLGGEFRVNNTTQYEQRFSASFGTGLAREETTRSVAVDHDGDFVVAWTSYGQDVPGDPVSGGVYFRMYDRDNNPIADSFGNSQEKRVNTYVAGHQRNAGVAMDADGDFVIAWESQYQDPDGTWGIYAQRYNSKGDPIGGEFRVNSDLTGAANQQFNPAVAMDDAGNFIVTWATVGQNFSFFNDVHAQRYNYRGEPEGTEIRINEQFIPHQDTGVPGTEVNPTVGMDDDGNFAVAWDQVALMDNGVVTDTIIQARLFTPSGSPNATTPGEFRVDEGSDSFLRDYGDHDPTEQSQGGNDTERQARNPQLAMDQGGNFIVVWETYHDNDIDDIAGADSYGVYFRRFLADGTPEMTEDHQANLVITTTLQGAQAPDPTINSDKFAYDQVNPSVAMDADGDYAIVWNGNGAEPFELNSQDPLLVGDHDLDGIFIRSFHADDNNPGSEEYVTVQRRVNRVSGGLQEFPSIGMEPDGDMIVVWSGNGVGDPNGIFARRYDEHTDTAGPLITELRALDGRRIDDSDQFTGISQRLVVVLDEQMWTLGPDSVTNPENWRLQRNGVEIFDAISAVAFGLNPLTNKWEAQLEFANSLAAGNYTLTALTPVPDVPNTPVNEGSSGLRDAVGNPLARWGMAPSGQDLALNFIVERSGYDSSVTNGRTYPETRGATGVDSDGDHVVVLTATDPVTGLDTVYARMYDADGNPSSTNPNLFSVTTGPEFADDQQRYASVACDADGDFLVTWTNYRDEDGNSANGREQQDVYARRFDSAGDPQGEAFRVNTYTNNNQKWSSVAVDHDGDSVITWSSYSQEDNGQLGSGYGVYARRFDSFGRALGSEFRVNVTPGGNQRFSNVDMNGAGGFVVAWTSDQAGVGDDIVARVFNADGSPRIGPLGGEIVVNYTTAGNQRYPDVAITPNGNNFVVTWTSSGQDGSGDGIFARMIDIPLWEQTGNAPMVMPPYVTTDGRTFSFGNSITSTVDVPFTFPDNFLIADVNVIVNIAHPITGDVKVSLTSPSGTSIELFSNVPYPLHYPGLPSSDFDNTLLDDEAFIPIDAYPPAIGPYNDPAGYIPEEALDAFDGQLSSGTWQLFVQDEVEYLLIQDDGTLISWELILERVPPINPANSDLQVNTSTVGNQGFSSVAMNRQGQFTVTWTGRGDQPYQEDQSGTGIFYQEFGFNGEPIGEETRANTDPDGSQRTSSIGSDGEGNFVIVWTGPVKDLDGNIVPGATDVYRFLSTDYATAEDFDGPVVSDIWYPSDPRQPGGGRTRLVNGDALAVDPTNPITQLIVAFGEELSTREIDVNEDGVNDGPGPDSVLNPDNWILSRDGSEIPAAVSEVTFAWNPLNAKYEAQVLFSEAVLTNVGGVMTLPAGNYSLVVSELINDAYRYRPGVPPAQDPGNDFFIGNALDGDYDGSPGTSPDGTGQPGYLLEFTIAGQAQLGAEFLINESPFYEQRCAPGGGIGYAQEESTRSVAVDHDGDVVVVWTSYDQDDGQGADVYFRLYDRNNVPLTGERRVNLELAGDQLDAAVAMDADGEFVIAWQSEGQDPDGSAGIFARRYSSVGDPLAGEFRVNSNTTGDQFHPAVAMDDQGNFVVVWGTAGQRLSYSNDVQAQRYSFEGVRLGSEFQVNEFNNAGAAGFEVNPAVAMDPVGNFVVAWDQITAQQNGVIVDSQVAARIYDNLGVAAGGQFQADSGVGQGGGQTDRAARNPQVTMDDAGNFIVVWESFTGLTYDVFYQSFDAAGGAMNSDQVNQVEVDYDGHQVNPSVAVDADGDFAVVWNGAGARPNELYDPANPSTDEFVDFDSSGVFLRHTHAAQDFSTVQTRVNLTEGSIQEFPSIAMQPDGDRIVVWNGTGVGDRHGIFARRYDQPADNVGPRVTDLLYDDGTRMPANGQVSRRLDSIIVTFDEEMMQTGPDGVSDPSNYRLLRDGVTLVGGIRSIQFGLDQRTNKFSAQLTFDGNGAGTGVEPLAEGNYEIIVSNSLRDVVGNPLGSLPLNPNGAAYTRSFNVSTPAGSPIRVNNNPLGSQGLFFSDLPEEARPNSPQSVASDADGDYVAVFVDDTPGREGVYAKLYDLTWTSQDGDREIADVREKQVTVTRDATAGYASVDLDVDGDFIVTWSAYDQQTGWDVYARKFDADANPMTEAFRVNSETEDSQRFSSVALDADGDFAVVWQSFGQDDSGYGIYAQRYNAAAEPIGGLNELQVLNFVDRPVGTFRLGFEGRVTDTIRYDGNAFDVTGPIEAELAAIGVEVQAMAVGLSSVAIRFVGPKGMQDREELIVVDQVLSGGPTSRITVTTQADGRAGEFRVNDTTEGNQQFPSVDMNVHGKFIVTWTSFGQDGDGQSESNVYGKEFADNSVFQQSDGEIGTRRYAFDSPSQQFPDINWAVSTDDPDNHLVLPGGDYDGVVRIENPAWPLGAGQTMGSGVLLKSGMHVITAAHVVDMFAGIPWPWMEVVFDLPAGPKTFICTEIYIHPDWDGDAFNANDLAIIVLPEPAPEGVQRYDIHRGGGELGQVMEMVGYGVAGQGAEQFFDNQKRVEYNVFEVFGEAFDGQSFLDFQMSMPGSFDIPPGAVMSYDFDSGLPANDTFGALFGMHDLGLGIMEGSGSHGDSGGGAFLDGKLIGVTSFGIEYVNTDVDALPFNVSYGTSGFYTRVSNYADWIDRLVEGTGPEFLANTTTAGNQKWSSVALDDQSDDFVITWTSYGQDGVGSGSGPGAGGEEGVYAQRFGREIGWWGGIFPIAYMTWPLGPEVQVNTTADNKQQAPRVAMDAQGNYVVTWESFQDRSASSGPDSPTSFGVYAQRYVAGTMGFDANGNWVMLFNDPFAGPNGEVGGELAISGTSDGSQRFPDVGLSDTGDYVVLWSGTGEGDEQGVFHQRYQKPDDTAGPRVADVLNVTELDDEPFLGRVLDRSRLDPGVTQFVVTFSENLSTEGGQYGIHSVLNPANWKLTRDGDEIYGGIAAIEFGEGNNIPGLADSLKAKYQAVLTFDADRNTPGNQPLERGDYVLTVRDSIEDLHGNGLDGDFDGLPNRDFDRSFKILLGSPIPPGPGAPDPDELEPPVNSHLDDGQYSPAIASNPSGDYVIVWTGELQGGDFWFGGTNIIGRRFNRFGDPVGAEFLVASHMLDFQDEPAVAMDEFGNFVVAWSGQGEIDDSGVFARVFDAYGVPQGDQFRVNQYRENVQDEPSVAMDASGEFVVSWTSFGQDGDRDGVFARRYHVNGRPVTNEMQVNTTWANRQDNSDVAMDDDGDFVVVWSSDGQDGSALGIYAQRFNADGSRAGGEFRINAYVTDKQIDPRVALDADGDFVATWASFLQDGSGYGVYARRYTAAGVPRDGADLLVNQTTEHWQVTPDVGISDEGDFVVTWSTFDQDDEMLHDYGIFARMFNADGSDYVDPVTGAAVGEFLVNITTEGDQVTPAVAVDSDGNHVIAWIGPDLLDPLTGMLTTTGIFSRVVGVDAANYSLDSGVGASESTNWPVSPSGFSAVSDSGSETLSLTGTPGDDVFHFIGGPTPQSWVVKLNGVVQDVDPEVLLVSFYGGGGEDTVMLTGTNADETIDLWGDRGELTFGAYTVTVSDVDTILAGGGGGTDVATMHDSPGDDNLSAGPGGALLTGPGFTNRARGFESVVIYATEGGYNVAKFFDSPQDDHFVAAVNYGKLYGPGFTMEAKTFNEVHAYATAGGLDVARVYDSPGDDVFGANPLEASLFGDGYYNRIKFFEAVHGFSNAGGNDVARLNDSAGDDNVFASAVEASLYGDGFYNRAKGFESVYAYAVAGGVDEGRMVDSPGNDNLVTAPDYAAMFGQGFYNRIMHFDGVHAYATEGGIDEAKMFDSAGDDKFVAAPDYGALFGEGFYNRAMHFEGVHAYASAGGDDEAELFDSGEDDKFVGLPDSSALFRPGRYYNRAKFFETVHARAENGGNDRATLYDATLGDGQVSPPPGVGPDAKVAWLYQFEECFTASKDSSQDPVQQAVDDIFSAYWP